MRSHAMTSEARSLTGRISAAVREIEPTAKLILYGSRARGDAKPDSDWDVLVLLDGPVGHHRRGAVIDRLYQLELEADVVLGVVVESRQDWDTPLFRAMPFHENVNREGIQL